MVALIGCVEVGIRVGVQQKIGAIESIHMGLVIVLDGMGVEEFTSIVGVIAGVL